MKLTQKAVAALQLDGKPDLIVFDSDLHGFGYRLRLGAGGKVLKSWVYQYKKSGSTRRITVGSDVLSAAQAREKARKLRGSVESGEDPQADRRDRRAKDALTMRALVTEFLAAKGKRWRARTLLENTRYLTHPRYFGGLHSRALDSISLKDVASRLVAVQHECGDPTAAKARSAFYPPWLPHQSHREAQGKPFQGEPPWALWSGPRSPLPAGAVLANAPTP
jgi:hypothetical protein